MSKPEPLISGAVMEDKLKNCWEILKCGREKGGNRAKELGVCIAARKGMGHSCWAIAGTLCGGRVQGTAAMKEQNCLICNVYKLYQRTSGKHGKRIKHEYPEEEIKYNSIIVDNMRKW